MYSKIGRFPLWSIISIIIIVAGIVLASFINWNNRVAAVVTNSAITIHSTPNHTKPEESSDLPSEMVPDVPVPSGSFLQLMVSEGHQIAPEQAVPSMPVATGEPLAAADAQRVMERLPVITAVPNDILDFRFPDAPIARPRTGNTIDQPFPLPTAERTVIQAQPTQNPTSQPTAIATNTPIPVSTDPLAVLRVSPEGELADIPFINITFNQAMVSLTALAELPKPDITLSPNLPGAWSWVSPEILRFTFEEGTAPPKATDFTVTIPTNIASATGKTLSEPFTWTFSTPTLKLAQIHPSGTQRLDPLFFVAFDQPIDSEAIFAHMLVTAGRKRISVRLATAAEIEADSQIKQMVENGRSSHYLVFRAAQTLPADAHITVTFPAGLASTAGPRLTTTEQAYSFRTYAPLTVTDHTCTNDCLPSSSFHIAFNNALDTTPFSEEMITISPDLADASIQTSGNNLIIHGQTITNTTYQVRLDTTIQDIFEQTLGKQQTLTFRVTEQPIPKAIPLPKSLSGHNEQLITFDPSANPFFSVYSVNHKLLNVQIYAVDPQEDWQAYQQYRGKYLSDEPVRPPGKRIWHQLVPVNGETDVLTETAIDLSQFLDGETGHLLVIVDSPWRFFSYKPEIRRRTVQTWVQMTQIGVDALKDHSEMIVWTTDLQTGSPLSDVQVSTLKGGIQETTDSAGLAQFSLNGQADNLLIAQLGADSAIMPLNTQTTTVSDDIRWYVFDDRQLYRPGEEVHVKGWLRHVNNKQGGDVGLMGENTTAVSYRIIGPQGNEHHSGSVDINGLSGFDLAFTLPEHLNLGQTQLVMQTNDGHRYTHAFQIQEFRRPEFEVKVLNETVGPHVVHEPATIAASANYYAGGPLPNADVAWQLTYAPTTYTPPNWSDFSFGEWVPWWHDYEAPDYQQQQTTFAGVTDGNGKHYLQVDFQTLDPSAASPQQNGQPSLSQPYTVHATASVMDANRQAWSGNTSFLVHPSVLYVGLRSDRSFVKQGQPLAIEAIVTNPDGDSVPDQLIQLTATSEGWQQQQNGEWETVHFSQECAVTSATAPVPCSFETDQGGTYQITAVVTDAQGHPNESRLTRWVSGSQQPASNRVEQEAVTLIPDQETYQPGDTAEILVQPPFTPAEGLLTVERNGILYTEQFRIEDDTHVLKIPITEAHIPNLYIQVDLVGSAPRTDDATLPPRPAYATGRLRLDVPPYTRSLSLTVTPDEPEVAPASETAVTIQVTDSQGHPVPQAELAIFLVDEAVLALGNYQLNDPINFFYPTGRAWVNGKYGRANIILVDPQILQDQIQTEAAAIIAQATAAARPPEAEGIVEEMAPAEEVSDSGSPEANQASNNPISVRRDFNPLAAFIPTTMTDEKGKAVVDITLPDNLTRYRIMAVAVVEGNQFGTGESNLTARLPLMVRPSAPRFLNFGDQFEFPILLQNQTDQPLDVAVVMQATNLSLTEGSGWRVTLPPHNRVELRVPAAAVSAGTARYQIAAISGEYADAALGEFPVYTPATTEAFATYGVVDEGAVIQRVSLPTEVIPQFGNLELTTSSTALQSLTDAVLYLINYEYASSEALASQMLAIAALRDVLTAFEADGMPSPQALETAVPQYIEQLQGMQNRDGGFPTWERGKPSVPFHSVHVVHSLARAQEKGFDIPANMLQQAINYLTNIETIYPDNYNPKTRTALSAYALYTRHLLGDSDPAKARALYDNTPPENLTLETVAWLWHVMADDPDSASQVEAIRNHINNRAVETPGAANFTTSYGDDSYLMLHSDRRTDGIILEALIANDPDNDLIPKVVNGLLAHRTQGRWGNTQENVFILLALDSYFNAYEKETPDFVARIWLGEAYAAEHEFVGRSPDSQRTTIPMPYLTDVLTAAGGTENVLVQKDGNGRLYYRIGLNYAPADLNLDSLDRGFSVERRYEAIDNPEDVVQDEDGVWHIKAGARVRVNITMSNNNRRYHVALLDPLPAGLEIINPALAVSANAGGNQGGWFDFQNMRDERAEAFQTLLGEGSYHYSYNTRATTLGTFITPPAKSEEMYSPEVFGRSSSDWVIIE